MPPVPVVLASVSLPDSLLVTFPASGKPRSILLRSEESWTCTAVVVDTTCASTQVLSSNILVCLVIVDIWSVCICMHESGNSRRFIYLERGTYRREAKRNGAEQGRK